LFHFITGKRQFLIGICMAVLILSHSQALQVEAFGSGASGPDVYAVQGMLKSLGYYGGAIDGVYGKQLAAGVRAFQTRYGLPVTGAVDTKTLQSILWAYGKLKIPAMPAPTPAPAPTPTPAPPQDQTGLEQQEQEMLELINAERAKAGLQPLIIDLSLSRVAELKSKDMIDQQYFSHESPTYGSPFEMMKRFGISYQAAGENIACNQTVAAAHQALMNSPGHRANILSSEYTHIGLGIVKGGTCGMMFTQMFIRK
jgi:uncharacterized YkwD family protein